MVKNRYTGSTRIDITKEPLNIVIIAGGEGYKEKTKNPSILNYYDNRPILEHQIKTILNSYPKSKITVTIGFKAEQILKTKQQDISFVENQLWQTTCSGEELRLYFNNVNPSRLLLIDGPVLLSNKIISCVQKSNIIYFNKEEKDVIGVVIDKGNVSQLSYGLNNSWSGILYLDGPELLEFKKICNKDNSNLLVSELINILIKRYNLLAIQDKDII